MSDDKCPQCKSGIMKRCALREDDGKLIEWYEECDNCFFTRPVTKGAN